MALVKCPECGNDISDKAKSCPKCGHPMMVSGQKPTSQVNVVVGAPEAASRPENNTRNSLVCPKCGSTNVHVDKKGFDGQKACCGFLTCGPLGFLCGTDGANKLEKTCLDCNKTW